MMNYKERMTIQLMRNRTVGLSPKTQADIAQEFHLSKMYVNEVINEKRQGPKAIEWRTKFAKYAGIK